MCGRCEANVSGLGGKEGLKWLIPCGENGSARACASKDGDDLGVCMCGIGFSEKAVGGGNMGTYMSRQHNSAYFIKGFLVLLTYILFKSSIALYLNSAYKQPHHFSSCTISFPIVLMSDSLQMFVLFIWQL